MSSVKMTLKNEEKSEEELTRHFKMDMRSSTNFYPDTQNSQKFAL